MRTELTPYQEFLLKRWQHLQGLKPGAPQEQKLLAYARFSVLLEAQRNGLKIVNEEVKEGQR